MKLYFSPGACSLAVHIALREIGVNFDSVAVDLAKHTTADGADFHAISPLGYVPLLQLDDGSRHTEVASLLQYVADLDPAQALIGATGSARRLAVVEWLSFVSTELHKAFSPWLWHKETADSTRQSVKDKLATRFAELDALLCVPCKGTVDPSVTARPRPSPVRPGQLSLRPEAQGAVQEVTNGLKHFLKRPRRRPAGHAGRNVSEH